MAELKTKPTAASVAACLDATADDVRRADCLTLPPIMQRATGAEPGMWGASVVSCGTYHHRCASGREGDWFLTGFSPRKQDRTLYLMARFRPPEALLHSSGSTRLASPVCTSSVSRTWTSPC